ncbi:MAG: hypothetical protein K8T91_07005 [Planctomycetes bacterium]|nr:hypothetical protein [Planctomycetota bacterium]
MAKKSGLPRAVFPPTAEDNWEEFSDRENIFGSLRIIERDGEDAWDAATPEYQILDLCNILLRTIAKSDTPSTGPVRIVEAAGFFADRLRRELDDCGYRDLSDQLRRSTLWRPTFESIRKAVNEIRAYLNVGGEWHEVNGDKLPKAALAAIRYLLKQSGQKAKKTDLIAACWSGPIESESLIRAINRARHVMLELHAPYTISIKKGVVMLDWFQDKK